MHLSLAAQKIVSKFILLIPGDLHMGKIYMNYSPLSHLVTPGLITYAVKTDPQHILQVNKMRPQIH